MWKAACRWSLSATGWWRPSPPKSFIFSRIARDFERLCKNGFLGSIQPSQVFRVVNACRKRLKDFSYAVVPKALKRTLVKKQYAESTNRVSSRPIIDEDFDGVSNLNALVFSRAFNFVPQEQFLDERADIPERREASREVI